jgi:uncharacterized membrane protein
MLPLNREGIMAKKTAAKQTTAPRQTQTQSSGGGENTGMAIVAYLIFFIPLITGDHRRSSFVKFHTNQGIVLFLFYVAYFIVFSILMAILPRLFISAMLGLGMWWIWSIIYPILVLVWVVPLIFVILGIVNAVKGRTKALPLIGRITILK